jgi:hypothetical protein
MAAIAGTWKYSSDSVTTLLYVLTMQHKYLWCNQRYSIFAKTNFWFHVISTALSAWRNYNSNRAILSFCDRCCKYIHIYLSAYYVNLTQFIHSIWIGPHKSITWTPSHYTDKTRPKAHIAISCCKPFSIKIEGCLNTLITIILSNKLQALLYCIIN